MKVGREQIVGLLVAVREYVEDPDRWTAHYGRELDACAAELRAVDGLGLRLGHNVHLDAPVLDLDFTERGS